MEKILKYTYKIIKLFFFVTVKKSLAVVLIHDNL